MRPIVIAVALFGLAAPPAGPGRAHPQTDAASRDLRRYPQAWRDDRARCALRQWTGAAGWSSLLDSEATFVHHGEVAVRGAILRRCGRAFGGGGVNRLGSGHGRLATTSRMASAHTRHVALVGADESAVRNPIR